MLRTRLDRDFFFAFERRYFDVRAQRSLCETDGHAKHEVVVVACEQLVSINLNDDVQVAARRAVVTGFTFAGDANRLAFVNASGDLDVQQSFLWLIQALFSSFQPFGFQTRYF